MIFVCEEHLGGDGAAEFGLVSGDVVLDGRGLCELPGEHGGEASDGGGGFRKALRVVGVFFGGLVQERAAGGAGGDVDERVRAVRGIEEVALEHHVGDGAGEGDIVRLECAKDGFEVVNLFGELGVGEGFAETGSVERDFDRVRGGDGEAEAAGGVSRCFLRA